MPCYHDLKYLKWLGVAREWIQNLGRAPGGMRRFLCPQTACQALWVSVHLYDSGEGFLFQILVGFLDLKKLLRVHNSATPLTFSIQENLKSLVRVLEEVKILVINNISAILKWTSECLEFGSQRWFVGFKAMSLIVARVPHAQTSSSLGSPRKEKVLKQFFKSSKDSIACDRALGCMCYTRSKARAPLDMVTKSKFSQGRTWDVGQC